MGKRGEWHEGKVDTTREHIEITWGPKAAEKEGIFVVARVAPSKGSRSFVVEFVLDATAAKAAKAIDAVRRELDFYLVEKGEENPWAYARYHCGTASNTYGHVHWSWQSPENEDPGEP